MTDKQQITILRKALVDVVQKLGEMPGWRKVEDGPPPHCSIVWVNAKSFGDETVGMEAGYFDGRDGSPAGFYSQGCRIHATHWRLRPASPNSPTLAETLQAICASALGDIEVNE